MSQQKTPNPDAFYALVEGVHSLRGYLHANDGKKLTEADVWLKRAISADPEFALARYYRAIALTHLRKTNEAIELLEQLNKEAVPFRTEVLYNLGFAFAKKYQYEDLVKSLSVTDDALKNASATKSAYLILLVRALQAFVCAVFGGRKLKHPEDFEQRRLKYLPRSDALASDVLSDPQLSTLSTDARTAIEVEAHNAAGIANMRLGQYASIANQSPQPYWERANQHYHAALNIHPRDVRVLDNISSLLLIQAAYYFSHGQQDEMIRCAADGVKAASEAISYNEQDRFRHYRLSQSLAITGKWAEASSASDEITKWSGVVTDTQISSLKEALQRKDFASILREYLPE